MKVSLKWLKEYVEIDITPEELAEKLTGVGIAVENIEFLNKGIEKVVVAKVLEAEKHPNAEKLSLCKVTTDGTDEYQVVCGAPNVKSGQKVAFALVGAILPGNVKIKKAKLRGLESLGMICSAKELGLNVELLSSEQKEGIMELAENAPLGEDIVKYLSLDDCVLEFELTPNRSDCLSIINIAREIAVILNKKVKLPEINLSEAAKRTEELTKIKIEEPELCYRYTARIVEGIKIGPSPQWLQHKLNCAGIRSINNVVDVTNYILLEMGQPLHAFDYQFLHEGEIIVRRAKPAEKMITLDNIERELDEEMLLITDPVKPVGIAGVMGGLNSEVIESTSSVLIESAYFQPTNIRRTSLKLGLRSEASIRFEKGINLETANIACDRAAQLIQKLAGGEILTGIVDEFPNPQKRVEVELKLEIVNKVLGTQISEENIISILTKLNFLVLEQKDGKIKVEVPPYRPDVTIPEDLIEEVARHYGYDNIPITLPFGATSKGQRTLEQKFRDKIIEVLAGLGLNEVINFSFINANHFDKIQLSEEDKKRSAIPVLNPLSEEQAYMRTSILPVLLDTLKININRRNENLSIFELGKIYLPQGLLDSGSLPEESLILGIAIRGIQAADWQNKGDTIDFYYIKGIVEELFEKLNLPQADYRIYKDNPTYHPGRTAQIFIENKLVGIVGELHPGVADNYDLSTGNYVAEIYIEKLMTFVEKKVKFSKIPKFPAVTRDLAIVIKDEISAVDLLNSIKENAGKLLREVKIFDVYKGNQIPDGHKSIAFAFAFQAEDRTLTDAEINDIYSKIQKTLEDEFSATLR